MIGTEKVTRQPHPAGAQHARTQWFGIVLVARLHQYPQAVDAAEAAWPQEYGFFRAVATSLVEASAKRLVPTGDGLVAFFSGARTAEAVSAALRLASRARVGRSAGISTSVALAAGELYEDDREISGPAAARANRLCLLVPKEEVWASREVLPAVPWHLVTTDPLPPNAAGPRGALDLEYELHHLTGLPEPVAYVNLSALVRAQRENA